jgi:hypothetical protein
LIDVVIFKGAEAPSVAKELAKAKIPVILTHNRGAPDSWEKKDILPGPPLSRSPASVLAEHGVTFGLAIASDGKFGSSLFRAHPWQSRICTQANDDA